MVDIKTCKEKFETLGLEFPSTAKELKFPITAKEEKKAFLTSIRENNLDLCKTPECKAGSEAKIAKIMDAHRFWNENHDLCNKITIQHIHDVIKDGFGFNFLGADEHAQNVLGDVVLALEKAGL